MLKNKLFYSPLFILLFAVNFFFFSCFSSMNMLPAYLSSLGAGKGFIGLFMNINSLEIVIFVLIFGKYSNKINKKLSLVIGFFIFIISMIFMYLFFDNIIILFIFRIISSIAYVFGFTMITNILFEVLPVKIRTGGIALFGISGICSNPFGAFLGEKIIYKYHPKYLFLLAIGLALIELILLFIIKINHKSPYTESKTFGIILEKKYLKPLILNTIIIGGLFSIYSSFIPKFTLERLGFSTLSFYFISFSIVAIIGRLFFARSIDWMDRKLLICIALSSIIISLILMIFLFDKYLLLAIGFFHGIGHSILYPVLNTSFLDKGNDEEKAILNNSYIVFYTSGSIFLSTLLGVIGDITNTIAIFIIMTFFVILSMIVTIISPSEKTCKFL
jgi:predicted MFS family arabinose efflux permease